MRSVRVYGGVQGPKVRRSGDLVLDPAAAEGEADTAPIRLHELTRKLLCELPERFVDLLEVASYVYSADQFARRDSLAMPDMGAGWRRSFKFNLAVRDLTFWTRQDVQQQLVSTLGFASDDRYVRLHQASPEKAPTGISRVFGRGTGDRFRAGRGHAVLGRAR
jgi:hypothetical protein